MAEACFMYFGFFKCSTLHMSDRTNNFVFVICFCFFLCLKKMVPLWHATYCIRKKYSSQGGRKVYPFEETWWKTNIEQLTWGSIILYSYIRKLFANYNYTKSLYSLSLYRGWLNWYHINDFILHSSFFFICIQTCQISVIMLNIDLQFFSAYSNNEARWEP